MNAAKMRKQELLREKRGPAWRSLEKAESDTIPEAVSALLRNEEGYRFLVENMREGLVMVDENAMITFANQKFSEIAEYTREELLGRPLTNAFKTLRDPYKNSFTERKKTGANLTNSEARLSAILSALPLGIGLEENRIMQWHNNKMADMLGYDPEDLSGKDTRMFYPNDKEYERAGKAIASLGKGKAMRIIDTKWARKDGSTFPCRVHYALLLDPVSEKQGIMAIAEDMTEKRRLEAQLQQSQKVEAIGTLAGGVAHDFNNLLTSILGNADLALMSMNKDDPSYEKFEEIIKAGKRAVSLIRQLLAFIRRQVIQPEVLNFKASLRDTEKMLRRLIGEDISFHTSLEENLWNIYADPAQMEQVLMNLVVNARDAMPKGGKLSIETANVELDAGYFSKYGIDNLPGPYVMLAVTDNGVGMDETTKSRIFDPFFTTKEKGKGTGLGLSMVYNIVKQNNGYIWIYSEEGKGTSFKVYLPRAEEQALEYKRNRTGEESLEGYETILLVEDEGIVRDVAEKFLKRCGYNVFKAANPEEAIRISKEYQERIHLLITDVVMPGMSGWDLTKRITSERPDIKVIYMSGYTNSTFSHHGVLAKELEFIEKPFSLAGLARKIGKVLNDTDTYQKQG